MGLFDKLKEKIAPQEPTLMEEIPKAEAWLKENMERFGQPLDGTHESFAVLDVFFEEQCKPGGLLAGKVRYMKNQLFAVGAYVGQVLVNELGGTWSPTTRPGRGRPLSGSSFPTDGWPVRSSGPFAVSTGSRAIPLWIFGISFPTRPSPGKRRRRHLWRRRLRKRAYRRKARRKRPRRRGKGSCLAVGKSRRNKRYR